MNAKPRILIVEDEFITANLLKRNLQELGYLVVAISKNAIETIDFLDTEHIDFVLLDIHIQGAKDGIWLAEKIQKDYKLPFIFISANSEASTVKKAVQTGPLGFIVKPFQKNDIFTTIEVALKNFDAINEVEINNELLEKEYTFLKTTNGYRKLRYSDITYIKSEQKYITIFYKKESILLRYGLQEFSETLPLEMFIRVHRSYLINKNKVDHINPNSLRLGDVVIPISASYKNEIATVFSII